MLTGLAPTKKASFGVADVPLALIAPRRVFARVEDVPAYGWSLALLLTCFTVLGYATVETGLIDREVDRRVQEKIALLEKKQTDVIERSALSKLIADVRKEGEFVRLMTRVQVIVASPLGALVTVLAIPALFYGIIALTGKKPEWNTLVAIVTFASFVDVVGGIVRLAFMLRLRSLDVDTSLGVLGPKLLEAGVDTQAAAAMGGLLSAVDPFRIWFWLMVATGLTVTSQLRGWKVWTTCTLFWLVAAGIRAGLSAVGA